MDYDSLLELAADLGYRLSMNGAETYRVEESMTLLLAAYSIRSEAFVIPNCMIISIETPDGRSLTRMRRIGFHGNDLDSVERYSNLCRRICAQRPDPEEAVKWMKETDAGRVKYRLPMHLFGNFLGAAGFAVFFGSDFFDCLISGVCGLIVGVVSLVMEKFRVNPFFRTISSSFLMALFAYLLASGPLADNADTIIIGSLMILVPGLLFTNAMRDIIYGDTNSGINRIVQVFLIAAAIALGTAAAWSVTGMLIAEPESIPAIDHSAAVQLFACFAGCVGFSILFNIHGPGIALCALGGTIAWGAYLLTVNINGSVLAGYFWAAVVSAIYAETMARIRKYPAISYLVVAIFPLIPGASVYYTMNHAVRGDMAGFASRGTHTIAIAGVIAVGLLMVSTAFRAWSSYRRKGLFKR